LGKKGMLLVKSQNTEKYFFIVTH